MKILFSSVCNPTSWTAGRGALLNCGHPAIARWLVRHPRICFALLRLLRRV